jgi:hypothetical protein
LRGNNCFLRHDLQSTRDGLISFTSAEDSSRLASGPPPADDHDKVEPTVRDALIVASRRSIPNDLTAEYRLPTQANATVRSDFERATQ